MVRELLLYPCGGRLGYARAVAYGVTQLGVVPSVVLLHQGKEIHCTRTLVLLIPVVIVYMFIIGLVQRNTINTFTLVQWFALVILKTFTEYLKLLLRFYLRSDPCPFAYCPVLFLSIAAFILPQLFLWVFLGFSAVVLANLLE